jgi:hypothetical protein
LKKGEKMQTEIQEFVLDKNQLEVAKLYHFREKGTGNMVRYVSLKMQDGKMLTIGEKYIPQLFRYLNVGIYEVMRVDYPERDSVLTNSIKNCKTNLTVSYFPESGHIVRIVSSDFSAISHNTVTKYMTTILGDKTDEPTIAYNPGIGMFAEWMLKENPTPELSKIIGWKIWVYNRNDGSHGLRMGAGFLVLSCKNGAVAWKGSASIKIIHRGDPLELGNKLKESIKKIMERTIPSISQTITNSTTRSPTNELMTKTLEKYPYHINQMVRSEYRLKPDKTLWGLSNAFNYLASHYEDLTFDQKIMLASDSVEVLKA